MFIDYISLGWDHILDINGYDHILFVLVLCSIFSYKDWKKIIVLVTAFTIGHCLTLILSGIGWININPNLIEMLIPITIIITALWHMVLVQKSKEWQRKTYGIEYSQPMLFGLIHGLGFSNFFKALLGNEEDIIMPLFAFNIGVELGQIAIICVYLFFSYLIVSVLKLNSKIVTYFICTLAIIASIQILLSK